MKTTFHSKCTQIRFEGISFFIIQIFKMQNYYCTKRKTYFRSGLYYLEIQPQLKIMFALKKIFCKKNEFTHKHITNVCISPVPSTLSMVLD